MINMKMEEESPSNPLAPPSQYTKSDEYNANTKHFFVTAPSKHEKPSSKCFVYTLFIVVLQSIAFLILGLVFLRIKTPTLRISQVVLRDLYFTNNSSNSTMLNATITSKLHLRNKNFGGFDFLGGNTSLLYENIMIGMGTIDEGRIGSREKKEMEVSFDVNINNNFELYQNFSRDVSLGLVKMRSHAELGGEVRVAKIMNRHRLAVMDCAMDLNLTSKEVMGLLCL